MIEYAVFRVNFSPSTGSPGCLICSLSRVVIVIERVLFNLGSSHDKAKLTASEPFVTYKCSPEAIRVH